MSPAPNVHFVPHFEHQERLVEATTSTLRADARTRDWWERFESLTQDARWADAVGIALQLLHLPEGDVIAMPHGRFRTVQHALRERLAGWPEDALRLYRLSVDTSANALWTQYLRTPDPALLDELDTQYFLSEPWGLAVAELARWHLDRGDDWKALRCLEALQSCGANLVPPEEIASLKALTLSRLGRDGGVRSMAHNVDYASADGGWLIDSETDALALRVYESLGADIPVDGSDARVLLARVSPDAITSGWRPVEKPIVQADVIVLRSISGLDAYRLSDGQRLWRGADLWPVLRAAEFEQSSHYAVPTMDPMIFGNTLVRDITVSGETVYALEGLTPVLLTMGENRFQTNARSTAPFLERREDDWRWTVKRLSNPAGNRVEARRLSDGRMLWSLGRNPGGPETAEEILRAGSKANLNGLYFLSAPERLGDKLIVLAEDRDGLLALAVESESGEVQWVRRLMLYSPQALEPVVPSRPTLTDEGAVYCVHGGMVFRLDIADGALQWASPVPRRTVMRLVAYQKWQDFTATRPTWEESRVHVYGDSLLVTASDSEHLVALQASSGERLYSLSRGGMEFVVGRSEDLFIAGASDRVMAIRPGDGSTAWELSPGGITGRPALLADQSLLLPRKESILVLDAATGQKRRELRVFHPENLPVFNLLLTDQGLVSAGLDRLAIYRPLEEETRRWTALAETSNTPAGWTQLARHYLTIDQPEAAADAASRALALNEGDVPSVDLLAQAAMQLSREDLLQSALGLVRQADQKVRLLARLATLRQSENRFAESASAWIECGLTSDSVLLALPSEGDDLLLAPAWFASIALSQFPAENAPGVRALIEQALNRFASHPTSDPDGFYRLMILSSAHPDLAMRAAEQAAGGYLARGEKGRAEQVWQVCGQMVPDRSSRAEVQEKKAAFYDSAGWPDRARFARQAAGRMLSNETPPEVFSGRERNAQGNKSVIIENRNYHGMDFGWSQQDFFQSHTLWFSRGADAMYLCREKETGKVVWTRSMDEPFLYPVSMPAQIKRLIPISPLFDTHVIIGRYAEAPLTFDNLLATDGVAALDLSSGTVLWKWQDEAMLQTVAPMAGGLFAAIRRDGSGRWLQVIDPVLGIVRWQRRNEGRTSLPAAPGGGYVLTCETQEAFEQHRAYPEAKPGSQLFWHDAHTGERHPVALEAGRRALAFSSEGIIESDGNAQLRLVIPGEAQARWERPLPEGFQPDDAGQVTESRPGVVSIRFGDAVLMIDALNGNTRR